MSIETFIEEYNNDKASMAAQMEFLTEALSEKILQMENQGWVSLDGVSTTTDDETGGPTLDFLRDVSDRLRPLAAENALFSRGAQLRNSYIFGRGMSFVNTDKSRVKKALNEDRHNKAMMFSVEAYEMANLALFCDGAFMTIRNLTTNRFTLLPLAQVTGTVTNPDDAMDIWYVQRSWSQNGKQVVKWLPTSRVQTPIKTSISEDGKSVAVDKNVRVYIKHTKRQVGWTWGVPDAFPAYFWAMAYSGALQDNAKLLNALSRFAWKTTSANKAMVAATKTRVEEVGTGSIGGTAMSAGGDLSSVGVPSAQVNFGSSQPLAALVAASFGVPVIALISSPGATGGSYGAAQTLDIPTSKGFEIVQNAWSGFYDEILYDLGAKDGRTEFPAIDTDAPYRNITSIATVVELGLIHRDEGRDAVLDILDIEKSHDDLPELPGSTDKSGGSVVSKQGVSGSLGATTNPQGDTNHDLDAGR